MNTTDSFGSDRRVNAIGMPDLVESGETIPGLWANLIPSDVRGHALLKNKLFFSLPRKLLDCLLTEIPGREFTPEILSLEERIAANAAPFVGYWNERSLESKWLAPTPLESSQFNMPELNWPEEYRQRLLQSLADLERGLSAALRPAVGYLGWLLTNRNFLAEHDSLIVKHEAFLHRYGFPRFGTIGRVPKQVSAELGLNSPNQEIARACAEFESFYIHWRLDDLNGPYLPNPLTLQLPVRHLESVLSHMREGGKTFYLPDIYPIPGRDELVKLIEEELRPIAGAIAGTSATTSGHLAEWHRIVSAPQNAKNQIDRYARIYRLQHFTRALYSRHSSTLRGKKMRLQEALATYFEVSSDTIKSDMELLSARLGRHWETATRWRG